MIYWSLLRHNYLGRTFNKDIFLNQDIFPKNRNIFLEDKKYLDYRCQNTHINVIDITSKPSNFGRWYAGQRFWYGEGMGDFKAVTRVLFIPVCFLMSRDIGGISFSLHLPCQEINQLQINLRGGSRNFVTLGKSDDIFRGVRGHSSPKFFEFWVSEMAFPALWEIFKQNTKISNHIIFKKHFVQMKTFIKY